MYAILVLIAIGCVFLNPLLFQWFWNDAIIICLNHFSVLVNNIPYTFEFGEISYWMSFAIINIIGTFITFLNISRGNGKIYEKSEMDKAVPKAIGNILNNVMWIGICVLVVNLIF